MSVPMSAPPASLQVDEVDAFMSGMVIHYLVGDDGSRTQVVEVAKNVARHGGVATSSYDARRVTHVVLEETTLGKSEELYARATKDKKRVVSWDWIEACLKQGALVPVDDSALYRPPPSVDGLPAMKDLKVCVTGYTGDRRTQLIKITERLGAEYMRVLDRKSTHLVCYEFEGAKWAKANQTGIQRVVSHAWLEDCLKKWTRLPEEPYTHRSGKEEDELAAAASDDVPDSQEDEEDPDVVPESAGDDFVTEFTEGYRAGAAATETAPGTMLRASVPGVGTETQDAAGGLADCAAKKTMEPPPTRARRPSSQPTPSEKEQALVGNALTSPDWAELEQRPSQHVERSERNRAMDPVLKAACADGGAPPADLVSFAGRVGEADQVEKAFGGRFADLKSERWHRFNDADAPLAADDFDEFCTAIEEGTWYPEGVAECERIRLRKVVDGERRFEILHAKPRDIPEGVTITSLPRVSGRYLAYLDENATEDDVEGWIKLARDAVSKRERGPLGAAVISRLRLEKAKQPRENFDDDVEDASLASSDALLTTFVEVYLPFGFMMDHYAIVAAMNETNDERAGYTIQPRDEIMVLPARVPGNLPNVTVESVERPISEVILGFHELLAGPTEPDPTQRPAANALPNAADTWTIDVGNRISLAAMRASAYSSTRSSKLSSSSMSSAPAALRALTPL